MNPDGLTSNSTSIGKNVSIAYPGETTRDYLRRQTGLREQYKFED